MESNLTKFIRAIRYKNNVSDIKAAHRCGIDLSDYIRFESNIGALPLEQLKNIFEAIEMTQEEFFEFQDLVCKNEVSRIRSVSFNFSKKST